MKVHGIAGGLRVTLGAIALFGVFVWTGTNSNVVEFATPAYAAADASSLTPDQIAAIKQCVTTRLANIDPALAGPARDDATQQALKSATKDCALPAYGPAAISVLAQAALEAGVSVPQMVSAIVPAAIGAGVNGSDVVADVVLGGVSGGASATLVAEAVIALTTQNQLAGDAAGTGLGQAAAQLANTNPPAANQIAQVVSNEGTQPLGQAFASSVTANGGSQELADAGLQNPNAIGETGGANNGSNGAPPSLPSLGSSNTTLPPCDSPSCT